MIKSFCSRCKEEKDVSEFGWNKQRNRPNHYCKKCRVIYNQQDAKKHKERVKASQKKVKLKSKYGITEEQYVSQLAWQNHSCLICFKTFDGILVKPHVDHDHATGELRGILCSHCNHGLGHFMDSEVNLEQAQHYLKNKGFWQNGLK